MATLLSPLVKPAGTAAGAAFGAVSRLRGTKSLHPRGVVHDARVALRPARAAAGIALFESRREFDAIVRFSRGAGLPKPLPDILGMAVRLVDAHGPGRHQDLLMVTSGDGPVLHHLLMPAWSFRRLPYSTVLPYRRPDGSRFIIGARARSTAGAPHEPLEGSVFDLGIAPLSGDLSGVGTLRIGARRPAADNAVEFNPFNTGGGLEPATFWNAIRRYAYPGSQAGWDAGDAQALTEDPRTAARPAALRR